MALLHFIPLLEVAWSDGSVSAKERAGILEMARARGIMEGSPAYRKLLAWLGNRPDAVLFARARTVVHDLLAFMTEDKRQVASWDLVAACEEIAAASGGILGLGSRTSAEGARGDRARRDRDPENARGRRPAGRRLAVRGRE